MSSEKDRLAAGPGGAAPWRLWGPYLSERQWGTVREDYSPGGAAWDYFPHDHARSRAYRWGEDGLAGISDEHQRLCFSLALWNGKDPILKERLFGLTNGEGNHSEDVKELYYYLDATPTHSYLKLLYKYPQREFPYTWLLEENRRRGRTQPEFELLDTGIFDDNRYFDVFVEYAKAGTEDILVLITAHNRGPETATVHLLPQLWFRNTWSWNNSARPALQRGDEGTVIANHPDLGEYRLHVAPHPNSLPKGEGTAGVVPETFQTRPQRQLADHHPPSSGGEGRGEGGRWPELLFCDNDTNVRRLYGLNQATGYFKDAFHEYLIHDDPSAIHPGSEGTKAGVYYKLTMDAGASAQVRLRLVGPAARRSPSPEGADKRNQAKNQRQAGSLSCFADFDSVFEARRREADEFYADLQKDIADADARLVQRQAFAGMIWSKQFFHYNVTDWLKGDPAQPAPPPERRHGRNSDWKHLNNAEIISMPDKWEYPWYAAWDLAFHTIALALVDAEFAKRQLVLLTREWYMHPNGQLPAYEWAFGDVNPPVHGWAAWRVFQIDRKQRRQKNPKDPGDLAFLERVYHKLLLNFTWWVNRKDAQGRNIFQGGFLGLDNIGVFDRSRPLPTGGFLNQADGTSWMAMYCLNLLRIALELARHNRAYEDIASKFFEHFLAIAAAINGVEEGCLGLWDEADEFYYDRLCLPNGQGLPIKLKTMVGLIPLFAVEVLEPALFRELPDFAGRMDWFLNHRPDLANLVSRWHVCGAGERRLLSLLRGHRMKCLLRRALDPTEFLSDHGLRALSKAHENRPYSLDCGGQRHEVPYWPAESQNGLFGGNSNWRGPVWMPVNYLFIESLQKFHYYYGDDFKVECPTGSGRFLTINGLANELARRLTRLFLRAADGQRPVLKYHPKLAGDPHFRDYVLFHEYFHGDTGRGVGASHQTGWTGLVAKLIQPRIVKIRSDSPIQPRLENCQGPG